MVASKLALSLMFLAAVTCATSFAAEPKKFSFHMKSGPETLDWTRAHTSLEKIILGNIMEGLVSYDSNLKIIPSLAKAWTVSEDGLTYTFLLRPNVKWSDGVPLKAQDFVYSWKRLLSPVTGAPYAYILFDIEGAEFFNKGLVNDFSAVGIKALDDRTLKIKLARRIAHWLYIPTLWTTFPLRQDIVEKYGTAWEKPGRMVTVGPFMIVQHDIEKKIVLRPNPHYYGTRGNIDEVTALIINDDAKAIELYEAGKLDFIPEMSPADTKRLEKRKDAHKFPLLRTGYVGFVTNRYPVSIPAVRRAIGMAIDRSKIPEIFSGEQKTAYSFVPPGLIGYSKNLTLPYDPERARAELRSTGIDPKTITLDFLTRNWDKQMRLAKYVQAELKKNLGITVNIQQFENKAFRMQVELRSFPMFESNWSADFPDADNFLSMFLSESGLNRTAWKNSSYDERLMEGRNLTTPSSRERTYLDAQTKLQIESATIIPIYYDGYTVLLRDTLKDYRLSPLGGLYLKDARIAP